MSMAPKRASKRQSKLGDDLVVLEECPKLPSSLQKEFTSPAEFAAACSSGALQF